MWWCRLLVLVFFVCAVLGKSGAFVSPMCTFQMLTITDSHYNIGKQTAVTFKKNILEYITENALNASYTAFYADHKEIVTTYSNFFLSIRKRVESGATSRSRSSVEWPVLRLKP